MNPLVSVVETFNEQVAINIYIYKYMTHRFLSKAILLLEMSQNVPLCKSTGLRANMNRNDQNSSIISETYNHAIDVEKCS